MIVLLLPIVCVCCVCLLFIHLAGACDDVDYPRRV
jgi:hypothetical protein